MVGRAGSSVLVESSRWFLVDFVVAMASPMLLADAVRALHLASEGTQGLGGRQEDATRALRDVLLPGAVERITKVSLNGFSPIATRI